MKISSPFDIGQSFFSINAYSQVTFTNTISLVYTKAIVCCTVNVPASLLSMFVIVPWFLGFSCRLTASCCLQEQLVYKKITSKVQE